jgi:hypothetical protein
LRAVALPVVGQLTEHSLESLAGFGGLGDFTGSIDLAMAADMAITCTAP